MKAMIQKWPSDGSWDETPYDSLEAAIADWEEPDQGHAAIFYDGGPGYGWCTFRHSADPIDEVKEAQILQGE